MRLHSGRQCDAGQLVAGGPHCWGFLALACAAERNASHPGGARGHWGNPSDSTSASSIFGGPVYGHRLVRICYDLQLRFGGGQPIAHRVQNLATVVLGVRSSLRYGPADINPREHPKHCSIAGSWLAAVSLAA